MNSPNTGNPMILKTEKRILTYKDQDFEVDFSFWICQDTKNQYTTTELDTVNYDQMYDQYNEKHKLNIK